MYCLLDFCCICFTNKYSLQRLYATDIDNITYFTKLTSCVPEMCFNEMNDHRLICQKCCENIEVVYKFRQKCLRSKSTLLDYIAQLHKISNIRGEVNVYLIDVNKFDTVKKQYRIDNIKTELFKDVDNDTNRKEHSEIKSECSAINLKLIDARPNYIKLGNVVIKMETEIQNYEHVENTIDDSLGNHDEINIDLSHNNIELAASEIKKENQNGAMEEHLQESFDNILKPCDSENINIEIKLEENFEHSKNLENCSEDFLLNLDEMKIDIVDNDIELMDSEINMQCKIEDIEEFSNEDLARPLKDQNVYDADKYEIIARKTMEDKSELIVASTSKVQNVGSRKVKTKKKQMHECSVCQKKFRYRFSCAAHMRIHAEQTAYECDICKKKFKQLAHLSSHMRVHTEKKQFECNICKKKLRYSSKLRTHMLIHTGEKPYECDICKKKFRRSADLSSHMRVHTEEKQFECNICQKKFRYSSNFRTHMLIHTGEKPYECNICKKKFRSDLSKHMLVHTGKKQFECDICKKKFKCSSHLTSHILIHTGEKPYECDVCKKKLRRLSHLRSHMLIHTGEKPYECDVCKKKFRHSNSLPKHMLFHKGERFECNICKKKFKYASGLSTHFPIHTGTKPYECKVCKKKFRYSSNLSRHMLIHT